LGAMCLGGMKLALHESVRYANERQQFGKSISSFGAIKSKLGEMAIRSWIGEAMIYRTLGLIEAGLNAIADSKDMDARLRAIEEYAAECSIIKVALSEYCNYITDEMVQIFGGYGYSADYPAERAYRDTRINRIFEGTNEINRMLIPGRLMKAAMSGRLALLTAAQKYMMGLADQQEILMGVADIITDAFAMESAILRTQKLAASQGDKTAE